MRYLGKRIGTTVTTFRQETIGNYNRIPERRESYHPLTIYGYTLVETIVSLVLLVAILVPLVARFHHGTLMTRMADEYVGIRLIEQEAAIVRTFPYEMMPIKRRVVGNEEWIIRTSVNGTGPLCYTMTAEVHGIPAVKTVFYGKPGYDKP